MSADCTGLCASRVSLLLPPEVPWISSPPDPPDPPLPEEPPPQAASISDPPTAAAATPLALNSVRREKLLPSGAVPALFVIRTPPFDMRT